MLTWVAIGHPSGMTAARTVGQVRRESKHTLVDGMRYAVVSLCVATGEDPAGLSAAY